MNWESYLVIYLLGVPVVTLALMDYWRCDEFLASICAALLWPILIPVRIIKTLIGR